MDPRLKRWGLLALVGVVLAAMLLLPGGDPILDLPRAWDPWRGLTPLASRQLAVQEALSATNHRINEVKHRRALQTALSDRRDPLVVSAFPHSDPLLVMVQREADLIWATLPARSGDNRTVLDISGNPMDMSRVVGRDLAGNCFVEIDPQGGGYQRANSIRRSGGECLFREAFGAPGPSWDAWQDRIPWRRLTWPGARPTNYERYLADVPEERPRAWFEFAGDVAFMLSATRRPKSSPLQLAYSACRRGRADQCRQAFQVDTGAALTGQWGDGPWSAPVGKLPAALLTDLGPAKFAELWRTDLPISTAYARVSGRSIDPILHDVTMQASGPRFRETPLPLLSWFGLVVWVGLLLLWARERVRGRVAA